MYRVSDTAFHQPQWINTIAIVGWSCADILIMIVSIGLTQRFQQINQRLQSLHTTRIIDEATWTEIRSHYVLVCELLDVVDGQLGALIVLSCTNNLCFICFQLLNTFESVLVLSYAELCSVCKFNDVSRHSQRRKLPYTLNYVYFWVSLVFLISRTGSVFLSAASIHDASQQPANVIRDVRTADWSTEAERLLDQLNNEHIALSGKKFFYLTRKVLLGVSGLCTRSIPTPTK